MQKYKDSEELIRIIQNKIGGFIQLEDNTLKLLKSTLDALSYEDYDKFRRNILRNIEMFVIPNVINFYYRDRLIKYFIKESNYISLDNLYNNEYKELVNIFIKSFYLGYSGQDSLVNNIDNLQIKILQKLKNEYFEGLANSSLSNINKNDYIFQFLDYVVNEYNLNNCGLNILTRFFFEQLRFQDINPDFFDGLKNYNKYFDKETTKMIFNLKKIYYTIFKIAKIGGITLNKLLLNNPTKELTFDFNSMITSQSKLIEEDVLKFESKIYYNGNVIFSTKYKRNNQIKRVNGFFINERGEILDIKKYYCGGNKEYMIGIDKLCIISKPTIFVHSFAVVDHNGQLLYSTDSFFNSDKNILNIVSGLDLINNRYLKINYSYYPYGIPTGQVCGGGNIYGMYNQFRGRSIESLPHEYELTESRISYIDLLDNYRIITRYHIDELRYIKEYESIDSNTLNKIGKPIEVNYDSIDLSTLSITTEKPLLEMHYLLLDNDLKQEKKLVLK